MNAANVKIEDVRIEINEQLEPTLLAQVSEVTGSGQSGGDDACGVIVWGDF